MSQPNRNQDPRQGRPHGRSASGTHQNPIAVDDLTPERSPRATGRVPFDQTYEARRSQMLDSMASGTGFGGYSTAQQSPPGPRNSPRGPQGLLSQAESSGQATGEQKKYPVHGIGMLDRQEMFDRGLIMPHPPEGPPLDESYNAPSKPPVTVDISTIAFFGVTLQELIFWFPNHREQYGTFEKAAAATHYDPDVPLLHHLSDHSNCSTNHDATDFRLADVSSHKPRASWPKPNDRKYGPFTQCLLWAVSRGHTSIRLSQLAWYARHQGLGFVFARDEFDLTTPTEGMVDAMTTAGRDEAGRDEPEEGFLEFTRLKEKQERERKEKEEEEKKRKEQQGHFGWNPYG